LEWCIYETKPVSVEPNEGQQQQEGEHEPKQNVEMNNVSKVTPSLKTNISSSSSSSNRPMEIIFQNLKKRNVLCAIEPSCCNKAESDARKNDEKPFLWLFILNERYAVPSEEEFMTLRGMCFYKLLCCRQ
jgi:hypothetical protein